MRVLRRETYSVSRADEFRIYPLGDIHLGCYSGTFLRTTQDGAATYAEVKGYMPMPTASVEIVLRPLAHSLGDRIQVVSRY
jgi:hypothetical protein